ncbi:MAG: uncharacterized protein JWN80_2036 [Microbacteriaceae bacterium]|nr:uncharacterized protein [Microbacteriaceae bacterium]
MELELIRRFSDDQYASALESWTFENFDGKTPLFTSPFGDLFLSDEAGVWYLDVLGGRLAMNWQNTSELEAELNTTDGRNRWLSASRAAEGWGNGLHPSDSEIFDFAVFPALGGPMSAENLCVADFVVSVNIAGQIHSQIRDLPPGTSIGGLSIG